MNVELLHKQEGGGQGPQGSTYAASSFPSPSPTPVGTECRVSPPLRSATSASPTPASTGKEGRT
eukprot:10865878-Prorocentrum_lima.AAC.1